MVIKVQYDVNNIYVSTTESPVYITVGYGTGGGITSVEWGDIDGTLSDQTDLQSALDAKVPYSGATGNVDLGEYELKAGQIELDQTPTGTAGVAVTRWNDTVGTIETTLKGGTVVLKHGRDMFERVVNKTGIQLTKAAYQAVKVSDAQGQRLAVGLAQANNDLNSADTIGLVVETIDNNQEGFIYTVGEIDGLNTTGSLQGETWADGDVLYLSPTVAGSITNVKPVAPQHLVVIGYVVYAHQNNGKIYVKVMNGWELGELHDVNTAGATNGQVLAYNGSIWVPTTNGSGTVTSITASAPLTGGTITSSGSIGITQASGSADGYLSSTDWTIFNNKQNALTNPITGSAASGQVAYFTGATTQAGSNNLFWDATNNRLGIGTNAPSGKLHISDSSSVSGNILNSARDIQISSNNAAIFALITANNTLAGNYSIFNGIRARGTITNPTSPLKDDFITGFLSNAYDGTSNGGGTAGIFFFADADVTTGAAPQRISFATSSTNNLNRTEKLQLKPNGNLILQNGGTFTDGGQRLQVQGTTLLAGTLTVSTGGAAISGDVTITGSGTTGTTNALRISNSAGTHLATYRNDGLIMVGNASLRPYIQPGGSSLNLNGLGLGFLSQAASQTGSDGRFFFGGTTITNVSDNMNNVVIASSFAPTSGTGTSSNLALTSTINQTGGANGITRGLFVNPTLTAAADWRSIEWSNNTGWGLYGAGTANNYLNGKLLLGTTTDSGQRLQVQGTTLLNSDTTIRGSGNTSAANALFVGNTTRGMFIIRNDGIVNIGEGSIDSTITNGQSILKLNSPSQFWTIQNRNTGGLEFYNPNNSTTCLFRIRQSTSDTSGANGNIEFTRTFNPTSGTATYVAIQTIDTINQTGGANGITRGLYVNPTLTAAADWRSIEWSNNTGWGLYGAGTALNYLAGNLLLGTTSNGGQRLQVVGDTLLRGSGATSATTGLLVQNSSSTTLLQVRNDGSVQVPWKGTATNTHTLIVGDDVGMETGANEAKLLIGSSTSRSALLLGQASNRGLLFNWTYNATPANAYGVLETYGGNNLLVIQSLANGDVAIGTTTQGTATKLTIGGTETASSAIARGTLINTTLTAAANNDVLVGLDVNPTFTNGAFTGVSNIGLRVQNGITRLVTSSGSFNSVLYVENTASAGQENKNIATFVGNRGNASNIDDNSTIGIFQKNNTNNNFGVFNFANAAGWLSAYFATQFVNHTSTPTSNFLIGTASSGTASTKFQIFGTGNTVIQNGGTFTDAGFRLDINGTCRVQDNLTVSKNQNLDTTIEISNTTSGTSAQSRIRFVSDSSVGNFTIGKFSATRTAYKILNSSDAFLSNGGTAGDIAIHNDFATGKIKFAAGGSSTVQAQLDENGRFAIGTATHNASAQLQVDSTTRGFLPPRMTETQKNAITTPAAGLMVYDTTNNKLYVYDGTTWQAAW